MSILWRSLVIATIVFVAPAQAQSSMRLEQRAAALRVAAQIESQSQGMDERIAELAAQTIR